MVRKKKRDTFTNTKEFESFVQLYGNKCEQLEEMDISKKKSYWNWPMKKQKRKRGVITKEIRTIVTDLLLKWAPEPHGFTAASHLSFSKEMIPMMFNYAGL